MKRVVILSGKGGVGKSCLTASLATVMSERKKVICADCDVDASNLSLIFNRKSDEYAEWLELSTNEVARVDSRICKGCRTCVQNCYFNAVKVVDGVAKVNEIGCEGCGACELICPTGAISLVKVSNAKIGYSKTYKGFYIFSAQLEPGHSGSGKVVAKVREKAEKFLPGTEIVLIDSAAGIGCPVIASVAGTDFALIVTEPTPSGYSDMIKAMGTVNHFGLKKAIVVNKCDLNSENTMRIEEFAKKNKINILEKVPYDINFVKSVNQMKPLVEYDSRYQKIFEGLAKKVFREVGLEW